MTTLAADKLRDFDASIPVAYEHYPVTVADIIFEGAAVTIKASGYARPAVVADAKFAGFATAKADNSAGAAGAINVQVRTQGKVVIPVTGVDGIDDVAKKVYLTDDNLFTLVATNMLLLGKVVRWVSGTNCEVHFQHAAYDVAT